MKLLEEYMENIKENELHSSSADDEEIVEEEDRSEDESDGEEVHDDDGPASRIGTAPEEPGMAADLGDINITGSSANLHEMPDANAQEDMISPPRSDLSRSPPQSRSVSPATLEK